MSHSPRSLRYFLRLFCAVPALLAVGSAQAAFTDHGNGTVTDSVTGLMWDKCSWGQSNTTNCSGGAASTHTWAAALGVAATANGAGHRGYSDWRLPNRNELESLVKINTASPAIDSAVFPFTESYEYWSSTIYTPDPAYAWIVYFDNGAPNPNSLTGNRHVRLVRSGQSLAFFDSLAADTTPDAFTFTDLTGQALNSLLVSNSITVAGINAAAPISVAGGEYRIGSGSWTSAAGTVNNGDTVTVRHTASGSFSTTVNTTLTIGGVSDTFSSTTLASDTTPDAFTFTDLTGQALNALVNSNSITVAGINTATPISATGGEYRIGSGSWTSGAGTVNNGDTVTVRHTTGGSSGMTVNTTLTIGGVSDTFSSTTLGSDTTPNAFTFTDLTGQALNALVNSNSITVAGINAPTPISVTGGEYRIGSGAWTGGAGTVNNGDTVTVRHTTGGSYGVTVNTTLTIGGVSDTFSSSTQAVGGATAAIPTLSEWGTILLSLLLAVLGLRAMPAGLRKLP